MLGRCCVMISRFRVHVPLGMRIADLLVVVGLFFVVIDLLAS
jgi:hypothetical protein